MANTPASPDSRAELREFLRVMREKNAVHREIVLLQLAKLRRISAELRARQR
jgi:hypothetical protein